MVRDTGSRRLNFLCWNNIYAFFYNQHNLGSWHCRHMSKSLKVLWTNSHDLSWNPNRRKGLTDEIIWSQPFHWPTCSGSIPSLEGESNFLVTKGITTRPQKVFCKIACCLKTAILVTWQSGVIKRLCSNSKTVDACAPPPFTLCSW